MDAALHRGHTRSPGPAGVSGFDALSGPQCSRRHTRLVLLAFSALLILTTTALLIALLARGPAVAPARAAVLQPAPLTAAAAVPRPQATIPVVVVGDSHAWLWAIHDPVLVDLGVPGLATPQILAQVDEALAMHPRTVVISAGTNDLNQGLGWASAAKNLATMVDRIKAAGAAPILLLVPQYGSGLTTAVWAPLDAMSASPATLAMHNAAEVPALNRAIRSLGVPLLEAPSGQTIDGVHLNATAYASLTRQLAAITG